MTIHLDCIPPKGTNQQLVRWSRHGGIFKDTTSKAAQDAQFLAALLSVHKPREPLTGPLRLNVDWIYPWRKSEPKKHRTKGLKHCTTRPDVDNLAKGLKDTMTRLGFWEDDSQISQLQFCKYWGDAPGITITITQLS